MLDATLTIVTDLVRDAAHPLTGADADYDPLLNSIGDARFVLLGEASHGTHEFYRQRAQITKRLIQEKGFSAVAVEADWPDAYRVNQYVCGQSADADAVEALAGFKRFPPGCGATQTFSILLAGSAPITTHFPPEPTRRASMDSTSIACTPPSRQF